MKKILAKTTRPTSEVPLLAKIFWGYPLTQSDREVVELALKGLAQLKRPPKAWQRLSLAPELPREQEVRITSPPAELDDDDETTDTRAPHPDCQSGRGRRLSPELRQRLAQLVGPEVDPPSATIGGDQS